MSTNQSAVTKDSKSYKESKIKFRKNALAMDYTEHEDGEEKINNKVKQISKELKGKR